MIWLIFALLAASFAARYGLFGSLVALALMPLLIPLAILGFFVLGGTFVALGG